MKVRELLNNINESLSKIKDVKFEGWKQYENILDEKLYLIVSNTEVGRLLRTGSDEIRFIKENEINTFGSVGYALFLSTREIDFDKRIKCGIKKGKIKSVQFVFNKELDEELLDFELKDLRLYFNKQELHNGISYCESEIDRLQEKIKKLQEEKSNMEKELESLN